MGSGDSHGREMEKEEEVEVTERRDEGGGGLEEE